MINIYTSTHQGLVRKQNQDRYDYHIYEQDDMAFVIVCDGMGGENAGEVASKLACETIKNKLLKTDTRVINSMSIKNILESAISVANSKVFDSSKLDVKFKGMGTTIVVMFVIGSEIHIMYAGDSRVYIIKNDEINQITKDHTVVQSLIDAGEITSKEAETHPQKHYITRALGVEKELETDYLQYDLDDDSSVLLCTDGLSNYLIYDDIVALAKKSLENKNVNSFIDYALSKGGADNVTAVLVNRRTEING